jgi:hypothetical protein
MRNLLEYPVTTDEIVQTLTRLSEAAHKRIVETQIVGSMECVILDEAIKRIRPERDETVKVTGKVSDLCSYQVFKPAGVKIIEKEGYHPFGYSDYITLEIDLQTGQILNWDADKVRETIREQNE